MPCRAMPCQVSPVILGDPEKRQMPCKISIQTSPNMRSRLAACADTLSHTMLGESDKTHFM